MRSLVEEVVLYRKPVEFDRRYGVSLTELLCNPWKPSDMPRINVPSVSYEPIGKAYNLPTKWEPPQQFGVNGPGEMRTVFPGLIERQRFDYDDKAQGAHINQEFYSIFQKDLSKPLLNYHYPIIDPLESLKKKGDW